MDEKVITLISEEAIRKRVSEIAADLSRDYAGQTAILTIICVLKGSFIFCADLVRGLNIPVEIEFVDITSYGRGIRGSADIEMILDLQRPVGGKDVLIVEDIIDSGRTISFLKKHILMKEPNSIKICSLLDKPGARVVPDITPDYYGFIIPEKFVVGYGLDYANKYRNLPYIGYLSF